VAALSTDQVHKVPGGGGGWEQWGDSPINPYVRRDSVTSIRRLVRRLSSLMIRRCVVDAPDGGLIVSKDDDGAVVPFVIVPVHPLVVADVVGEGHLDGHEEAI
jgi:hypothetical protein